MGAATTFTRCHCLPKELIGWPWVLKMPQNWNVKWETWPKCLSSPFVLHSLNGITKKSHLCPIVLVLLKKASLCLEPLLPKTQPWALEVEHMGRRQMWMVSIRTHPAFLLRPKPKVRPSCLSSSTLTWTCLYQGLQTCYFGQHLFSSCEHTYPPVYTDISEF